MKIRYIVACACLALAAPVVLIRSNSNKLRYIESDAVGDFSQWHPTALDIQAELSGRSLNESIDRKSDIFIDLFKQRFRSHDVAMSVRRLSSTSYKMMCAATIPRSEMSRMAVQLSNDAMKVLGHQVDVDVYETFISATNRKLAELRWDATLNKGRLTFDPKFLNQHPVNSGVDF